MTVASEATYTKPLPLIEPEAQPYWDGLKAHQMKVQRCDDCGRWFFPPRTMCPGCLSENLTWTPVSGRGKIWAAVTYHLASAQGFGQEDLPYNVSIVELEEGPRLLSNVIDCPPDEVKIGLPVAVVYQDVSEDITLAKFRAA